MTSFTKRLDTFFTLSREVNLAREADRRILHLIRKWLKAGVSEDGQWSETKLGTPQGSIASPLIANALLALPLRSWVDVWRKNVVKGDVVVVRFADDLVVSFQHRTEAERFLKDRIDGR
jgi:RNA-directed DNA polymerase